MQGAARWQGGFGRSWFALAMTAALHAAVIAAVFRPASKSPPSAGEQVTEVRLLPSTEKIETLLAPQLHAPAPPGMVPPVIAIAPPANPSPAARAAFVRAAASPISDDDALARYAALVRARIAAHKRAGLHRQGTALIRFALDRQGALVSLTLARSSGDPLLDAASLASVRAAAPFPPPPSALKGSALVFTIPFVFS